MTAVYAGARSTQAEREWTWWLDPEIAGREMRDSILAIDNAQARSNDLQTK